MTGPTSLTKEIKMFNEIFALTEDKECSLCCDSTAGGIQPKQTL